MAVYADYDYYTDTYLGTAIADSYQTQYMMTSSSVMS